MFVYVWCDPSGFHTQVLETYAKCCFSLPLYFFFGDMENARGCVCVCVSSSCLCPPWLRNFRLMSASTPDAFSAESPTRTFIQKGLGVAAAFEKSQLVMKLTVVRIHPGEHERDITIDGGFVREERSKSGKTFPLMKVRPALPLLHRRSICKHGCKREICKACRAAGIGGSSICEHGRQRRMCKACKAAGTGGSCIFEHSRQKSRCKECSKSGAATERPATE